MAPLDDTSAALGPGGTFEGLEAEAGLRSSWAPVPLAGILSGDYTAPEPSMLARTDGRCLIYPERVHAINAEPEALKSWLALQACAERLETGESVLYIDFEDAAPTIVHRLLALGVEPEAIAERFVYVRPHEPLGFESGGLDHLLHRRLTLAVIDGVTEAFSCEGLSPLANEDVATWLDLLPRRLARAGVAVLLLDHVVKDREARGRYAIGAQHKLAGIDVAYSLRVLEPFARGKEGLVSIYVEKDRPGAVRGFARDGQAALLRAGSHEDGAVTLSLEPPEDAGTFRPTVLMERISRAVEASPGLSKRAIRDAVRGKNDAKDLALELLIAEGFIEARRDGQAWRHHSARPYREADKEPNRAPMPQPCPNRAQGTARSTVPPCPAPYTGHGHDTVKDTPKTSNRAPELEDEFTHLSTGPGAARTGLAPTADQRAWEELTRRSLRSSAYASNDEEAGS